MRTLVSRRTQGSSKRPDNELWALTVLRSTRDGVRAKPSFGCGVVVDARQEFQIHAGPRLSGQCVGDIEDDFDSGPVKGLDHVAEFVDRATGIAPRAVRLMWRKERNRLISPVIHGAPGGILAVELKDRKQFHRGDTQLLQIIKFVEETCICSAKFFREAGVGDDA